MNTLLTDDEHEVVRLLGTAWNMFANLPELNPMDKREMCLLIHSCQEKVMSRPVLREFQEGPQEGTLQ